MLIYIIYIIYNYIIYRFTFPSSVNGEANHKHMVCCRVERAKMDGEIHLNNIRYFIGTLFSVHRIMAEPPSLFLTPISILLILQFKQIFSLPFPFLHFLHHLTSQPIIIYTCKEVLLTVVKLCILQNKNRVRFCETENREAVLIHEP